MGLRSVVPIMPLRPHARRLLRFHSVFAAIYFSVSAAAVGGELAGDGDDDLPPFPGDLPPSLCYLSLPYSLPYVTLSYPGGCAPTVSEFIQGVVQSCDIR